ncbi:MAG: prepilin-type N-terminal cleavage/methylation domain-containing protein [Candidatus Saccharimonadales bacterium]
MNKVRAGFTIVELIVVIVVIGILATITMVSYDNIRSKGYDSQRISDAKSIQESIELYRIKNNAFPAVSISGMGSQSGWESSAREAPGEFLRPLADSGYMESVPLDPINNAIESSTILAKTNQSYGYVYYRYAAGTNGCDATRGTYYILGIINLKTSLTQPDPSSPGFSCSSRDWQPEFSWVVGAFEK